MQVSYLTFGLIAFAIMPLNAEEISPPAIAPRPDGVMEVDATFQQQELLRQKLAERDALQREIDDLRRTSRKPAQLLINAKLIELNHTRCRQAGFDLATLSETQKTDASVGQKIDGRTPKPEQRLRPIEATQGFLDTLDALCQKNMARVVASPTMVTVSGRPASFNPDSPDSFPRFGM